jgi:hypothetical protein
MKLTSHRSDLTGYLLMLKVIKDKMLTLIPEPCAFAEGLLLQFVNSRLCQ